MDLMVTIIVISLVLSATLWTIAAVEGARYE